MTPLLSVLIASLDSRRLLLDRLLDRLRPQVDAAGGKVEMLVHADNGELTVGRKRQELLQRAAGRHVCYVDDDDLVSWHYLAGILDTLVSDPDCVAICEHRFDSSARLIGRRLISLRRRLAGHRCRDVNHLTPIRRVLALQAGGFSDMGASEDVDFGARVRPLLMTDQLADPRQTVYEYHFNPAVSVTLQQPDGFLYRNRFGGRRLLLEMTVTAAIEHEASLVVDGRRFGHRLPQGLSCCRFFRNSDDSIVLSVENSLKQDVATVPAGLVAELGLEASSSLSLTKLSCLMDGRFLTLAFRRPDDKLACVGHIYRT